MGDELDLTDFGEEQGESFVNDVEQDSPHHPDDADPTAVEGAPGAAAGIPPAVGGVAPPQQPVISLGEVPKTREQLEKERGEEYALKARVRREWSPFRGRSGADSQFLHRTSVEHKNTVQRPHTASVYRRCDVCDRLVQTDLWENHLESHQHQQRKATNKQLAEREAASLEVKKKNIQIQVLLQIQELLQEMLQELLLAPFNLLRNRCMLFHLLLKRLLHELELLLHMLLVLLIPTGFQKIN